MTDEDVIYLVVDTGPLLCIGAAPKELGLDLFHHRLKKRVLVPKLVISELINQSTTNSQLAAPAKKILAKGVRSILLIKDEYTFSRQQRKPVREQIVAEEITRAAKSGRPPKTDGHGGEVDAILLSSQTESSILFSNDHAALEVAKSHYGLPVARFATLLAAEIADGSISAEDAAEVLLELHEKNIHSGVHNISALNLLHLEVPDGF